MLLETGVARRDAADEATKVSSEVSATSGTTGRGSHLRWGVPALVLALAGLLFVILPRMGPPVGAQASLVMLTFVALVAESLPFLLGGAVLAATLQRFAVDRVLAAAARRPRLATLAAPLTGLALPLCDCGLVPLARRLHGGGAGATVVNGFVAGAPLTNPIVILSTVVAFPGRPGMVLGRVAVGLGVAMLAAALAPRPRVEADAGACHTGAGHEHGDDERDVLTAVATEFGRTGPTLVAGALVAATIKAFVPTDALVGLAAQPLVGAAALMLLAFVMAICSQADAFVAASLPVGTLPRLAFLALGPMLDVRLAAMYRREFGARWLAGYAATVVPSVLVLATVWATWSPW